ncbi:hypothetical protein AMJ74_03565 [candidate division WOR_3 bacterium SM1_77]|uniref:ACT domain-containing protein n=1 Tax=candidate division WOR_3 bacterium SM1_77 TaxID=1703778 RepID=A0A0S8JXQ5_UNCW3|nr:MAG: hypothetical protein AMJ74_03565 [candidate division WOR_3 bacterium SM1_77]
MSSTKEFRISLPNQPGQLVRVCEALSQRNVNIRTIAGIAGTNRLAMVTDQEDPTKEVLQKLGLSFEEVELLTVRLVDKPGTLAGFARKLADANINIESIYRLGVTADGVEVAFTVSDIDKAKPVLGL